MELALLRCAVLALHGVEADVARSKKEAENLLQEQTYDAALLCHSISESSARRLITLFREKNPGRCVIFVSRNPWQKSPVPAEATVCAIDGPDPLIEAVLSCARQPFQAEASSSAIAKLHPELAPKTT